MERTVLVQQQVSWRRFAGIAAVVYGVVAVLFFGDLLVSTARVVSAPGLDVTAYFLPLRTYGFGELAHRHLPQWNPHSYSGTPYAANIQAALFYPLNWIYLVLPVVVATNWSVALHFWLAAWFAALWAHARTGMTLPSLLAGLAYACCGGYFLHVHPGHLTVLCAGVWPPLLLLCVDRLLDEEASTSWRWAIAGGVAAAMPVLAGHPQTAYYAGLTAVIYALLHLSLCRRRWVVVGRVAVMFGLGLLLAAVQLLPTWALSAATTRAGGLSQEAGFAYALPPENLLTVVLPHLFGSAGGGDYLGRWFAWEASVFVGVVPAVLAAYAVTLGARQRRAVALVVILVMLAGVSPAVHAGLMRWLPGYATFRAAGRFGLEIDLLLAVLAADGLAGLVRRADGPPRGLILATAAAAVVALAAVGLLHAGDVWPTVVGWLHATGQVFLPAERAQDPAVLAYSLRTASVQFGILFGICVGVVGILVLWRRRPAWAGWCAGALVVLGAGNLLATAWTDRSAGPAGLPYPPAWARALPADSDARVMTVDPEYANAAMARGFLDAAGYDPIILGRYARFLAISQGADPQTADAMPGINKRSPLFRAIRVARVLYGNGADAKAAEVAGPLPRFAWVHGYEVHTDPGELYLAIGRPTFDPAATVVLESPPSPAPAPGGSEGTVRVLSESPESVEIEATTPTGAILLMTDAYAPGWRVRGVGAGPQDHYDLLPADVAIRAIPLAAGTHHLRIEYRTPLLAAGAWVSGLTVVGMVAAFVVDRRRAARHR